MISTADGCQKTTRLLCYLIEEQRVLCHGHNTKKPPLSIAPDSI